MDEYHEPQKGENGTSGEAQVSQRRMVVAFIVLLVIAAVSLAYGYHQQSAVHQLTTQASTANASVTQLQSQVDALTTKLNDMTAAQAKAQQEAAEQAKSTSPQASDTSGAPGSTKSANAKRTTAKRRPQVDKKYAQLAAQLTEQQKQLKETQDEVAKNRSDLETSLSATRDDLNGSIARTHDELVALEKKGERSYFEFDLSKSKQFSRVGPLTLSLRKADSKHKNYNLAMIVDDDQMQKKNVNLFEPIWIHTENESQPVQIVVNKIGKDFVHGYVSAPRYKPSELNTSGSAAGATVTPVAAKTPAAATTPNPNPQQPPPQQQPPSQQQPPPTQQ